jgi:AraC family transcriptional regulator
MHRVLEHIDRHLDERLDLEALSRMANFSSFRFHRLFTAWMGETLGEYLHRRRIEAGAMRSFFRYYPTDASYDVNRRVRV